MTPDDRTVRIGIVGSLLMLATAIGAHLSYHLPLEPRRMQPTTYASAVMPGTAGTMYAIACQCPKFGDCLKAQRPSFGQVKRGECPPEFGNGKEHQ